MKKIIAIGGGEIGRPGYLIETLDIDQEIIRLASKIRPTLLFIPTASGDSQPYQETVLGYFGEKLGCKVDFLPLFQKRFESYEEIKSKISKSDIIYVGGGNTLRMMKMWRRHKVDLLLLDAANKGKILSGISAGAICWFHSGNSDSKKFSNKNSDFIKVRGLNIIELMLCPHYNEERKQSVKEQLKNSKMVGIALENCAALEIIGDKFRIITSKTKASAFKLYWKNGEYFEEIINHSEELRDINLLFFT